MELEDGPLLDLWFSKVALQSSSISCMRDVVVAGGVVVVVSCSGVLLVSGWLMLFLCVGDRDRSASGSSANGVVGTGETDAGLLDIGESGTGMEVAGSGVLPRAGVLGAALLGMFGVTGCRAGVLGCALSLAAGVCGAGVEGLGVLNPSGGARGVCGTLRWMSPAGSGGSAGNG